MKKIRFYLWLFKAFIYKNFKIILTSFSITFVFVALAFYSLPIANNLFFQKKEKIGMIKKYTLNNPPEEILSLISNPLLTVNQNGEIIPILAKSWEILNENKRFRFHLRSDLYWSDNKKFTTKDLNYRFKDIKILAIDDYTLEFILPFSLSIFPNYLTKPIFKPDLKGAVGLYTITHFKKEGEYLTEVILQPKKENQPLKIYRFFDTEEKLVSAYRMGMIDLFKTNNSSIKDFFAKWNNTKVTVEVDYRQIITLFFNNNNPLLNSKEIRKSIVYLIPEFKEYGLKANGPISPLSWAYHKDLKTYSYSEEKAMALFKKNIKESTQSSEINFLTFYDYLTLAEKIKKNLEKLQFKVNLKIVSSKQDNNYDLFLTSWIPPDDPDQYYFWHSTQKNTNFTNYINLKVDSLLEKGRQTIDPQERKNIYREFQEIIVEDVPAYFIYYPYYYNISRM